MRIPVANGVPITLNFGIKDNLHPTGHNGIDYSGRFDRNVYAPEAGTLKFEYQANLGGNVLILTGARGEHHLAHLEKAYEKSGSVQEGEIIGKMGSTGLATAVHLHWGLKRGGQYVNPLNHLEEDMLDTRDKIRLLHIATFNEEPVFPGADAYLNKKTFDVLGQWLSNPLRKKNIADPIAQNAEFAKRIATLEDDKIELSEDLTESEKKADNFKKALEECQKPVPNPSVPVSSPIQDFINWIKKLFERG